MATGITAAVALVGVGLSIFGGAKQAKAAKKAAKASRAAERARQSQAKFEALQARREAARVAQRKRADIVSASVSSGVDRTSSPVQVGARATTADRNRNITAIRVGERNSDAIFSANRQIASAQSQGAVGQGISNLGSQLFSSSGQLGKVGESASGIFSSRFTA